jgi:hypothetical protein
VVNKSFAEMAKIHQVQWANQYGLSPAMRECKEGREWVLTRECRDKNLYRPEWWDYIKGREHRWSRALNSSQCFAVNLFAPLKANPSAAKSFWTLLLANRTLNIGDNIEVDFEFCDPQISRDRLGEQGQPTQVDVLLTAKRAEKICGFVLVEVKYTESEFGHCRGSEPSHNTKYGLCSDIAAIVRNPKAQCWLTREEEKRRYWEFLLNPPTGAVMPDHGPCPFKGGLYQLMRNRLLANCLKEKTNADWADVAICVHSKNKAARTLREPIHGEMDVVNAFDKLMPRLPVRVFDPAEIVTRISGGSAGLSDWATYMRERYDLEMQ